MTTTFSIDPTQLPAHAGVPAGAVSRLRSASDRGFPELEKEYAKLSAHRTLLGENEERWPQEVREALLAQHPWLSGYTVTEHVTTSSQEGYATGFFRITPKYIPIATAGSETVTVVTVPFIVRDFELYPLDVFSNENKSYPLTKNRVAPLLRLRDAFREVDREQTRLDLIRPTSHFTSGPAGVGRKYSSASDLHAAEAELVGMTIPTAEDLAHGGFKAAVSARLEKIASLAAAEIEVSADTARYRIAWASDPETGGHRVGDWTAASLHKLSQIFGEDTVGLALQDRHVVLNRNPDDPEALLKLASNPVEKVAAVALPLASLLTKQSEARAASVVRVVNRPTSGHEMGHPAIPEVTGVIINSYIREAMDGSYCGMTHGAMGIINEEGVVFDFKGCGHDSTPYMVPAKPGGFNAPAVAPQALLCAKNGTPPSDTLMAVWAQDDAVYGIRLLGSTVVIDDMPYYSAKDGYSGEKCLVCFESGFERAYAERMGDTSVLHVPAGSTIVGGSGPVRQGAPISVLSLPAAAAPPCGCAQPEGACGCGGNAPAPMGELPVAPAPMGELPVAPELPEKVVVSHSGGRWKVAGTVEHGIPVRSKTDALFALAAAGVTETLAVAAVKTASATRQPVSFSYRAPKFDEGERVVLSSARAVAAKLSGHAPLFDKVVSRIHQTVSPLSETMGRLKGSSIENTPAVDTVLSLGFLTRENLLRFVDMQPSFRKTLSYLCSLLLAARLGLDEVDENAVESAIRGLDEVLESLGTVEFALTQH